MNKKVLVSKELLYSLTKKDFKIDYYRASGPGGQKVNKTSSAVRITHLASGAIGQSQDERKQSVNQKIAFTRLVESKKFLVWHRLTCAALMSGESVEEKLNKAMASVNLKIEVKRGKNKWELE